MALRFMCSHLKCSIASQLDSVIDGYVGLTSSDGNSVKPHIPPATFALFTDNRHAQRPQLYPFSVTGNVMLTVLQAAFALRSDDLHLGKVMLLFSFICSLLSVPSSYCWISQLLSGDVFFHRSRRGYAKTV